ncbi:hypothetical protein BDF19DRAFT_284915 [Syncephalis fuscata]|nr:hypothetical protein BDF19DRAFT_284915 [Syncephalis fuscata]
MEALTSFILGIISGLLCCIAYTQWQFYYSDAEHQPLLGATSNLTDRPRSRSNTHLSTLNSNATLSEPPSHYGIGGLTWLSSRLFSLSRSPPVPPPRRPRLDTATISGPIHAPVVGSYLPILRSMLRPPPLPALEDASVRWADYGRKRELAQSVLQHLTHEPPLGRHLRMAVRAVLHLSQISPEAMAIDTLEAIDSPLTNEPSTTINGKTLNTAKLSSSHRLRRPARRKTIAPLLHEATHEEDDGEEEEETGPPAMRSLHRSVSTSVKSDRPVSDPTLLEAIARFHAHEIARKDTLQNGGTPHATPVTSNTGTVSRIDDTMHSHWDTAVLVAAPASPRLATSRSSAATYQQDANITPRASQMIQQHNSIRSITSQVKKENEDETDKTFVYPSKVHPMDAQCLSTSPETDQLLTNGDMSIAESNELEINRAIQGKEEEEVQLRASLEELQQKKRSRRRGDLLSTLMDMSIMSLEGDPLVNKSGTTSPTTMTDGNILNQRQSVHSQMDSRPTSSVLDMDASFYTPPETPSTTMKARADSVRSSKTVGTTFPSVPSTPTSPPPLIKTPDNDNSKSPTHPRIMSSTRRRTMTPSSATSPNVALETPFFTSEQMHEWHVPGYGRVRFTDHCPQVFADLRRRFGVQLSEIDEALRNPFEQVTRTSGKSEAIFFATDAGEKTSPRRKFLFKTLRGSEPENLKSFLPRYLTHVRQNPDTLLPRYLGMFTFERPANSSSFAFPTSTPTTPATPSTTHQHHHSNSSGTNPLSNQSSTLSASPTAFASRLNDVMGTIARDFSAVTSPTTSILTRLNRHVQASPHLCRQVMMHSCAHDTSTYG